MNLSALTVGTLPGGDMILGLPDGRKHDFETGKPVDVRGELGPMSPNVEARIHSYGLHPNTVQAMLTPKNAEALGI